ncbi:hypothetical protein ACFORL_10365 [Legionella dresdenensis]|uniref:Uncharacterized protein n=1 Tax=Legionella dresdenensis TaxID=450200 RepID=A0ABV8CGZ6_9GAMM
MATWKGDLDSTYYLFYQGKNTFQTQAANYTGNQTVITTTGEAVRYNQPSILAFPPNRLWLYPEINEINRESKFSLTRIKLWLKNIQIRNRKPDDYQPPYPINESGRVKNFSVNPALASLGQKTDISNHARKANALSAAVGPDKKTVYYGVSRGGSTTFVSLAMNRYPAALCVLEGAPASISGLFKVYFSRWLGKLLYNKFIAYLFLGRQHVAEKNQQARAQVEQFPLDVPLVIVSSRNDGIVAHKSSFSLALRVANHRIQAIENGATNVQPVYFLQLDKAGHNSYFDTRTYDGIRYQNFLHAVYRKHNLPYVEEYADRGECEFITSELTQGVLRPQVILQREFWQNREERKATRNKAYDSLHAKNVTLPLRAISMAAEMPLFAKHRSCLSFFNRTATQKNLDRLGEKMAALPRLG